MSLGVFASIVAAGIAATSLSAPGNPTKAKPPKPVAPAVSVAPTGNDATCVRLDPNRPCATFSRAFEIASSGDTVGVSSGTYPVTDPNAGATTINPPSVGKSAPVTFVCKDTGVVSFDARNFSFFPGVSGVTFRGSCFRFHIVHFGYGGYQARTQNIVLDGVHMDSFECAGCANVTITNSEVGPITACYRPGTTGPGPNGAPVPPQAWCDPANPVEAYWATQPNGTINEQTEPYIHGGGAGTATNFRLTNDHIHNIQTKDAANVHIGGLLIWSVDGLVVTGNTFDHNAIYNIQSNDGDVETNGTIERNTFGWPVTPIDPGQRDPGAETKKDWREVTLGYPAAHYSNWKIRFNTFAHGLTLAGEWTNTQVVGNVLGNYSTCAPGVEFTRNVGVAGGASCGGLSVSLYPYADYQNVDFRLNQKSRAARYLAAVNPAVIPPAGKAKKPTAKTKPAPKKRPAAKKAGRGG